MTDTTEAKAAADLASLLPTNHPLARLGRLRLDAAVRRQHQEQSMNEDVIQVGSKLRDAAVDPLQGDFAPMREVKGHPGVWMRATAGEPEFAAAVVAARAAAGGGA